jgi:hypothetical protein
LQRLKRLKRSSNLQLQLAKFIFNAYVEGRTDKQVQTIDLLLNEVVLALLDSRDPTFKKKNGLLVRKLGLLLFFYNKSKTLNEFRQAVSLSEVNLSELSMTERQFNAANRNLKDVLVSYTDRQRTLSQNKIPPARFIGVGYKDKGSRKISSYDGSPSWQEVASSLERADSPFDKSDSYTFIFALVKDNRSIQEESQEWIQLLRRKVEVQFFGSQ